MFILAIKGINTDILEPFGVIVLKIMIFSTLSFFQLFSERPYDDLTPESDRECPERTSNRQENKSVGTRVLHGARFRNCPKILNFSTKNKCWSKLTRKVSDTAQKIRGMYCNKLYQSGWQDGGGTARGGVGEELYLNSWILVHFFRRLVLEIYSIISFYIFVRPQTIMEEAFPPHESTPINWSV